MKNNLRVVINEHLINRIFLYAKMYSKELSGFGIVNEVQDKKNPLDHFLVVEKLLFPKQKNTGTTTQIDEDIMIELVKGMPAEDKKKIKFWWHSHVNMSAFWSGTDEKNMEDWSISDYLISLVVNKKNEYKMRFFEHTPRRHQTDDIEIIVTSELPQMSEISHEIMTKIHGEGDIEGWCLPIEYIGVPQNILYVMTQSGIKDANDLVTYKRKYTAPVYTGYQGGYNNGYDNGFGYDDDDTRFDTGADTYWDAKDKCYKKFTKKQLKRLNKASNKKVSIISGTQQRLPFNSYKYSDELKGEKVYAFLKDFNFDIGTEAIITEIADHVYKDRQDIKDAFHIYKGAYADESEMNEEMLTDMCAIPLAERDMNNMIGWAVDYIEQVVVARTLFTRFEDSVISFFLQEDLYTYLTKDPVYVINAVREHNAVLQEVIHDNSIRTWAFGKSEENLAKIEEHELYAKELETEISSPKNVKTLSADNTTTAADSTAGNTTAADEMTGTGDDTGSAVSGSESRMYD